MTMANPFTKPKKTGCGTSRINLPILKSPNTIWIIPVKTTAANKYSTP